MQDKHDPQISSQNLYTRRVATLPLSLCLYSSGDPCGYTAGCREMSSNRYLFSLLFWGSGACLPPSLNHVL